jgi:hypothetical protein
MFDGITNQTGATPMSNEGDKLKMRGGLMRRSILSSLPLVDDSNKQQERDAMQAAMENTLVIFDLRGNWMVDWKHTPEAERIADLFGGQTSLPTPYSTLIPVSKVMADVARMMLGTQRKKSASCVPTFKGRAQPMLRSLAAWRSASRRTNRKRLRST